MTWNLRILAAAALLGLAGVHTGCVALSKALIKGPDSQQVIVSPGFRQAGDRFAPSDPRDLAWLAGCDEIHVCFKGPAFVMTPGETIGDIPHGGGVIRQLPPLPLSYGLNDRLGRMFTDRLRCVLPGRKLYYSPKEPSDGAPQGVRPGSVAVCFVHLSAGIAHNGDVGLVEEPALFYPLPPDRSRIINEAFPNRLTGWRAQPAIGAERGSLVVSDRYYYLLATKAEITHGWLWIQRIRCDVAAVEAEICAFVDRRADDLARQVAEAVGLNAGSVRESKSPD